MKMHQVFCLQRLQSGLNVDFARQQLVHRARFGHFEQTRFLSLIQITRDVNLADDLPCLASFGLFWVEHQIYFNGLQIPTLVVGIHLQSHGGAGAQSR